MGWEAAAVAEIAPDSTLPQPSRVARPRRHQTVVTAGTQQGRNLFHSFRAFSVPASESASFQPDAAVRNIFVRVTGRNRSRINGRLEVLQSPANLFLLNPNGITFGRNAELRVGGSFVATTADQINFADGRPFSAIQPQTALLSVSTPVGLQLGNQAGSIISRSTVQPSGSNGMTPDPFSVGLIGSPGQTLALIGGDVRVAGEAATDERSGLSAAGGRIALGSGFDGQVRLMRVAQGWRFGYASLSNFGEIRLQDAVLNVSGFRGGAIQLQGERVRLHNSFAFSDSKHSGQRGSDVIASGSRSIVVEQGSFLSSSTQGAGRAGDILLDTPQLTIRTGGQVSSATHGSGRSGNIQVNAARSVTVEGVAAETGLETPLSLLNTFSFGSGDSGDLDIATEQLRVRSGGQIGTTTSGKGTGGNLSVRAREIELIGTAQAPNGQPLRLEGLPAAAGLFAGTEADGDGGRLDIETQRLTLRDGAILQATTYGSGAAGDISVQAETIQVSGSSAVGGFPARIAATSGGLRELNTPQSRQATGRGGNLEITTDRLSIQNGGVVAANSLNPRGAGAGTISIQARQVELSDRGELNAQTESGNQARIQLSGVELLTLRQTSNISTTAGIGSDRGNAGNIDVTADVILAAPAENSNINADARAGRGGNITIQAQGILGITERRQQTPQSDITATSESNVNGEISISTTSIDPTQGVVALPDTIVDASRLIAQGCQAVRQAVRQAGRQAENPPAQSARQSEFVITGRGGLPPNPSDLGGSSAVMPRWVTAAPAPQVNPNPDASSNRAPAAPPILEAQGWVTTAVGQVALVAQSPVLTPDAAPWQLPACLAPAPQRETMEQERRAF
ncbi:MAG: filamentous hemagglutinin N-terminal domain-containing protein [Pegethrix bostrychoides GSE-TBD4-15B]|uniref:Filamentous hemagglutinin N-terminal domain-containing protein n=1 Tax=Pegethrix bostrychoides GSE-TBD4-15B TaxID=2839662 RepID=A0A951P999_9CYAN|nr:filamentous hemagglutinin N-terminal domain-containing protein [Pegethrix bostrychoides GSE-TBD4-15B]